jgi:hypothetical protein
MPDFKAIGDFLFAVLWTYCTAIGGVVSGAWWLLSRVKAPKLHKWWPLGVLLALLLSSYQAWNSEHLDNSAARG